MQRLTVAAWSLCMQSSRLLPQPPTNRIPHILLSAYRCVRQHSVLLYPVRYVPTRRQTERPTLLCHFATPSASSFTKARFIYHSPVTLSAALSTKLPPARQRHNHCARPHVPAQTQFQAMLLPYKAAGLSFVRRRRLPNVARGSGTAFAGQAPLTAPTALPVCSASSTPPPSGSSTGIAAPCCVPPQMPHPRPSPNAASALSVACALLPSLQEPLSHRLPCSPPPSPLLLQVTRLLLQVPPTAPPAPV